MTDNRTTELLRKLLDERGVEWTYADGTVSFANNERWFHAWAYNDGAMCVSMGYLTPEQAIAAMLGSRRNTSLDNVDAERDTEFAKTMHRIVERNTEFGVTDIEESHRKADELMCDLLLAHGYAETVDAFKNMRKWYG